ncbi:uncharacterized protein LOC130906813 [Corythoichthys intestinalis]|uniref:uncharacterized protein LOC130906813 n=1 Tax=Corythoichthys intestinalis TaxID=161448 RepID=UPI0025A516BA|nr:uncharacterized protein LOC130906813 [Corythoichthys intestinalis]
MQMQSGMQELRTFPLPFLSEDCTKKSDMAKHLVACQKRSLNTSALAPGTTMNPLPSTLVALTSSPLKTVSPFPVISKSPSHIDDHTYCAMSTVALEDKHMLLDNKKVKCPHCSLVCFKKNIPKHIQRKHKKESKDISVQDHLNSACVDPDNAIFAVQKSKHGFSVPVHVQNKTFGHQHKVECELEECRQYHFLAVRSGLPFKHCEHIRSLQYCTQTVKEERLLANVLEEMVALQFFGVAKKASCLKRQHVAQMSHIPLCAQVDFKLTTKHLCFSIYEPVLSHYTRLGRLIVTYNASENTWHCPCAKPRRSCLHKNISKWHLFQTNRDLFITQPPSPTTLHQKHDSTYPPLNENLRQLSNYIYTHKKLPDDLPGELLQPKATTDYMAELHPAETICTVCPDTVQLHKSTRITGKAKIVTMNGVIGNVSTYFRRCPQCQMVYRYQERKDGLHNFNDHLVLSLELCVYLRHNLQNHVSISKVIHSLESLRKEKFPAPDTICHAYYHFEALTNHDYSFSCVCCGYYPPVVVMDLHKKGVFNLPVSDIKEASEDFTGEVDIEHFWDNVQLEMISYGFTPSIWISFYSYLMQKNPFGVKPNFEYWAPWIGKNTRKSEVVLNTEYEKLSASKSSAETEVSMVSEDRLVDELMKQKVSTVRKLCKACNLDCRGSRMDLIIRLREEMKTRHSYDKIFQKIWGASGGWSVILCPHAVVYSLKFNLRAESPRDFTDLLLSWKHLPNVSVYDFARDTSGNNEQCGTHCAVITNCESIRPCRASWAVKTHPAQERLLAYILDIERPETELIVQTNKACLTRSDFWTLGLNREMESTIGNACLELVQRIAHSKGKNIFVADLYVVATWRKPTECDPLMHLPIDVKNRDAVVVPIWQPGHFMLSVSKHDYL